MSRRRRGLRAAQVLAVLVWAVLAARYPVLLACSLVGVLATTAVSVVAVCRRVWRRRRATSPAVSAAGEVDLPAMLTVADLQAVWAAHPGVPEPAADRRRALPRPRGWWSW